jgi:AraC-like DNA-binding protein
MFMHYELTVSLYSEHRKVFLQDGFYASSETTARLHNHNYSEIHVISGGSAVILADNEEFCLSSGDALIIPKGIYHCFTRKDASARRTAFQIDFNIPRVTTCHIGSHFASEFLDDISSCQFENKIETVPASIPCYILLLCLRLCNFAETPVNVNPITDYGFLIHEFFSSNYSKNIHLSDLAEFLHLSERHTERLIIEHTGNTFRKELVRIRTDTAKKLLDSGISMKKAAEYVGYNSYTGFWKAMKSKY